MKINSLYPSLNNKFASNQFYKQINQNFGQSQIVNDFGIDKETVAFYDKNAPARISEEQMLPQTLEQIGRFLNYIPQNGEILDAGCGTGRDSEYFQKLGYKVDAFDASQSMCNISSSRLGIDVKKATFLNYESEQKYDGIYARNSLLHVPREGFVASIQNMQKYLKPNGILFVTIKSGFKEERDEKGRLYSNYSFDNLKEILNGLEGLDIIKIIEYKDEISNGKIIEFILRKHLN